MEIGELIQQARLRRGWSRSDLAAKSGVSAATITRVETGERVGHAETIARIARTLDLPAEDVFTALLGESQAAPEPSGTIFDQVAALLRRIERLEGRERPSSDGPGLWGRIAVGVPRRN